MKFLKIDESAEVLGTCYQSAYKELLGDYIHSDWKLVHGIVKLTGGAHKGKHTGHAWIENDQYVIDTETSAMFRKEVYYKAGNVSYTHKYTYDEAMKMAVKSGHYGPWDKKIWNA